MNSRLERNTAKYGSLDNYWRIEEKDDGVYVQVESVGLSRTIPAMFAWLIYPSVKDIPRNVLSEPAQMRA